jgi:hypothetical protein
METVTGQLRLGDYRVVATSEGALELHLDGETLAVARVICELVEADPVALRVREALESEQ